MVQLRVTGIYDSVTLEEMAAAVVGAGGCRTDEDSKGVFRTASRGHGAVWFSCS
jgi:hypothetical protein